MKFYQQDLFYDPQFSLKINDECLDLTSCEGFVKEEEAVHLMTKN